MGGGGSPGYDWEAERRRQEQERERQRQEALRKERLKQAEEEERAREEARLKQFEQDKQKALNLLKSGSGQLGLRDDSGDVPKLKGGTSGELALKEPRFSKGTKDSAPVDLRDKEVETTGTLPLKKETAERGVRFREVPSPEGYKSKSERRAMAAALSDEHLLRAVDHTAKLLQQMKEDFLGKTGELESLLDETKDSEKQAIKASLDLLTSGLIEEMPETTPFSKDLKLVADRANKLKGHHEALKKQSDLEIARSVMLDAYDTLAEHSDAFTKDGGKLVTKKGAAVASLASFAVDYSYEVMRWAVARNQMQLIIDNLDKPNGKLEAQQALKRLYEDLVEEKKLRGIPSQTRRSSKD